MAGVEDLLRRRQELMEEIDREIERSHARDSTILFTDIVGSTRYYEQRGDIAGLQMVVAHNDLLFPIIREHGGRILKTIGDSIMALFDDPSHAVICTVSMQRAIAAREASGRDPLSVRMGLHVGRALQEGGDVFGDAVNTAARVESCARGGEIIVTDSVRERAGKCGVTFVPLGRETVKGREQPVELYMVDWRNIGQDGIRAAWGGRGKADVAPNTAMAADEAHASSPSTAAAGSVTLGARPDPASVMGHLPALSWAGNPYLNRVMIPHPGMFFGRQALVRRILGRLAGPRPQSLSLVGERRIGKSSLLNYLRSPPARASFLPAPESCYFVLVDFQQARALDAERFAKLLVGEICRQAHLTVGGAEDLDCLRRIGEVVAAAGCRLVLLFDEFEAVTRNKDIGPSFYAFLRSLANTLPISFICASGQNLKNLCVTREISDSPFFNIFATIHVGPLELGDARTLVRDPSAACGRPLEPVTDAIIAMGGLLPFFLQIACSAWFEFLEDRDGKAESCVGSAIPREVLETFREETQPHFEFILDSSTEEEREAFREAASTATGTKGVAAAALERRGYLLRQDDHLVPFSAEFAHFLLSR